MLDGRARGFGAGAGNAQLEVLVAVLERLGWKTAIDLYKLLDAGDLAEKELMKVVPTISSVSVARGPRASSHTGFWQCMDTVREVDLLNALWASGKAPWKTWE